MPRDSHNAEMELAQLRKQPRHLTNNSLLHWCDLECPQVIGLVNVQSFFNGQTSFQAQTWKFLIFPCWSCSVEGVGQCVLAFIFILLISNDFHELVNLEHGHLVKVFFPDYFLLPCFLVMRNVVKWQNPWQGGPHLCLYRLEIHQVIPQ